MTKRSLYELVRGKLNNSSTTNLQTFLDIKLIMLYETVNLSTKWVYNISISCSTMKRVDRYIRWSFLIKLLIFIILITSLYLHRIVQSTRITRNMIKCVYKSANININQQLRTSCNFFFVESVDFTGLLHDWPESDSFDVFTASNPK